MKPIDIEPGHDIEQGHVVLVDGRLIGRAYGTTVELVEGAPPNAALFDFDMLGAEGSLGGLPGARGALARAMHRAGRNRRKARRRARP